MSVPVPLRHTSKLEVEVKAEKLARYTAEVLSNAKKFDPKYSVLADRILGYALDIYLDVHDANIINVKDKRDYDRRRKLQDSAYDKCGDFTRILTFAKRVYHVSSRRIYYWTGLILDVKDMVKKWRESDARRYRGI